MLKCIQRAMDGDARALALCIERIAPVLHDADIKIRLPKLPQSPELSDIEKTGCALLNKMANGDIPLSDGQKLHAALQNQLVNMERRQFEARVTALEHMAFKGEQ